MKWWSCWPNSSSTQTKFAWCFSQWPCLPCSPFKVQPNLVFVEYRPSPWRSSSTSGTFRLIYNSTSSLILLVTRIPERWGHLFMSSWQETPRVEMFSFSFVRTFAKSTVFTSFRSIFSRLTLWHEVGLLSFWIVDKDTWMRSPLLTLMGTKRRAHVCFQTSCKDPWCSLLMAHCWQLERNGLLQPLTKRV